MSSVSLTSQVWCCSHPKINGENAARAQSARIFDPSLNLVSNIYKNANDTYFGRPSVYQAANGTNGLRTLGYAGLNPTNWIGLETGLRQVAFVENVPTLAGANQSASWGMFNGSDAYVNTPQQNNCYGQLTAVDHQRYLAALYNQYRQ